MAALKLFVALLPLMFVIDLVWLGVVMKDFYRGNLGHLMASGINWAPGIVFYVIFVSALIFFAVLPGVQSGSLTRAIFLGAAFGFAAYATYDLTNQATLKDWPLIVTLVDMTWGAFLSGLLAGVGFFLHRWLV